MNSAPQTLSPCLKNGKMLRRRMLLRCALLSILEIRSVFPQVLALLSEKSLTAGHSAIDQTESNQPGAEFQPTAEEQMSAEAGR